MNYITQLSLVSLIPFQKLHWDIPDCTSAALLILSYLKMPRNITIEEEVYDRLEDGGGLNKETLRVREMNFECFEKFVRSDNPDTSIEGLLKTDEGKVVFGDILGRFFFSLRVVAADDGTEKLPKRRYAEKIRSNIKCVMVERFKVDITDPASFPQAAKRWKSFLAELVKNNRAETEHHEEVDPETMNAIMKLLVNVKNALLARGTEKYNELLSKIPAGYHGQLNYLLQYGALFILTLYEVRRGREGLELLRKADFTIFEDAVFDFKYIR